MIKLIGALKMVGLNRSKWSYFLQKGNLGMPYIQHAMLCKFINHNLIIDPWSFVFACLPYRWPGHWQAACLPMSWPMYWQAGLFLEF